MPTERLCLDDKQANNSKFKIINSKSNFEL